MSKSEQGDAAFFAERAETERVAADVAADERVRRGHLESAVAFENLSVALTRAHQPTLTPPAGSK